MHYLEITHNKLNSRGVRSFWEDGALVMKLNPWISMDTSKG